MALVAASSANASGYYIGLFGGISTMEDDFTVSTSTSRSTSNSTFKEVFQYSGGINNAGFTATWAQWSWDTQPYKSPSTTGKAGTAYGTFQASTNQGQPLRAYAVYQNNTTLATGATMSSRGSFDDGFVVGGSVGWDFGNGWRTELEAAYRNHDLSTSPVSGVQSWAFNRTQNTYGIFRIPYSATYYSKFVTYVGLNTVTISGTSKAYTSKSKFKYTGTHYINNGLTVDNHLGKTGTAASSFMAFIGPDYQKKTAAGGTQAVIGSASGELETWSFMFNIWHDFDFGDSPIHPFIGGGVGFANASLDYTFTAVVPGVTYASNTKATLGSTSFAYRGNGEATDWGFAYQLGAGLGYDFGNGMMLSAQYRYFNTGAMDLSLRDQIEVNLESHNFLVGLNIPIGGGM